MRRTRRERRRDKERSDFDLKRQKAELKRRRR
jgi:hypothetical protein